MWCECIYFSTFPSETSSLYAELNSFWYIIIFILNFFRFSASDKCLRNSCNIFIVNKFGCNVISKHYTVWPSSYFSVYYRKWNFDCQLKTKRICYCYPTYHMKMSVKLMWQSDLSFSKTSIWQYSSSLLLMQLIRELVWIFRLYLIYVKVFSVTWNFANYS